MDRELILYYFGFGVARLSTIIVLPVASRVLGVDDFGAFEVSLAILLASTIAVDAGIGAFVLRFGNDARSLASLLPTALRLQVGTSLLGVILFAAPMILARPDDVAPGAVLLTLAGYCIVERLAILGAARIRVQERFRLYLILSLCRAALTLMLSVPAGLAFGSPGILGAVAIGGLPFALSALAGSPRGPSAVPSQARAVAILKYGLPLVPTGIMVWALSLSDRLFLQTVVSAEQLSQYGSSYRLGSIVGIFIAGPVAVAWIPIANREGHEIRTQLSAHWARVLTLAALGATALVVAASVALVPLVFGAEYEAQVGVVAASGVSGWLFSLYFLFATNILLSESTVPIAACAAIVVAANFLLNSTLIPIYGITGAAIATVTSYFALVCVTSIAARQHGSLAWVGDRVNMALAAALALAIAVSMFHPFAGSAITLVVLAGGVLMRPRVSRPRI